jgi:ABC-type phosphate transport system ATPase subunit
VIVLTSVEVTNIRSVAHGRIEPLPGGITALVGAIGTGKSTFLEADGPPKSPTPSCSSTGSGNLRSPPRNSPIR